MINRQSFWYTNDNPFNKYIRTTLQRNEILTKDDLYNAFISGKIFKVRGFGNVYIWKIFEYLKNENYDFNTLYSAYIKYGSLLKNISLD